MAVSAVVVEADVAADVEAAVVVAASANVTNAMGMATSPGIASLENEYYALLPPESGTQKRVCINTKIQ